MKKNEKKNYAPVRFYDFLQVEHTNAGDQPIIK